MMEYKNFNIKRLISISAIGLLLLSSCKNRDPKVMDVHYVDLQLTSFSLSSKAYPGIDTVRFSINQGFGKDSNGGEITNQNKFGYKWIINNVKLNIRYDTLSVKSVLYAVGTDGVFMPLIDSVKVDSTKVDSVNLKGQSQFRLKLLPKDKKQPERLYTVTINQYTKNPDQIYYTAIQNDMIPSLLQYTSVLFDKDHMDIYTADNTGNYLYHVFGKNGQLSVTKSMLDGINAGEIVSQVVYTSNMVGYCMTNTESLYKQTARGDKWILVPNVKVKAILGGISNTSQETIAVVIDKDHQYYYGTFDGDVFKMGTQMAENFPVEQFANIVRETQWVGNNIKLIGGKDIAQQPTNKIWYTTNGTDWLSTPSEGVPSDYFRESVTQFDGKLYRFVSTQKGLALYTSSDLGATWQSNAFGFPSTDNNFDSNIFSQHPYITFVYNHKIYLLGMSADKKPTLYEGTLGLDL